MGINKSVLPKLKRGVILVNTSRGGLDVYENEGEYFFRDWSGEAITDSNLVTLLGNNRVVMTAHQAFFTREAIDKIVATTIDNFRNFSSGLRGKDLPNGCG